MMEPKYQANGDGMAMAGNGHGGNGMAMETEWEDWRQGECLLPQLVGKFYDQQQWCDVRFCLADGSVVAAHKLVLAITSSVFEGMFFGPLADKNLSQVRVEDVKPAGFKRLIHFIYNSRCLSWKMDDPEEWWHVLEAANKYMNTRLVEQIERRLRDIARKEGGKGVILKHLKMAYRIGFDSSVKTVFLNSVIKNTSKLIQTDQWNQLEESSIMKIYDQDFLAATEGELYMGAKTWCLRNTSSEAEALKIFLEKFAPRITPEYMSQRDFLTYVANDAFLAQVDVFRDWTIKILVKNASENTIRGSYRPMRVLHFYFNAEQKGNSPTQFKEEVTTIDFPEEVTKYTAAITSVWDGDHSGLHLNLKTESQSKPDLMKQARQAMNFARPGPKSTKGALPNLPEMVSDEEAQRTARKSALIVARMKDGSFRAEVLANMDDAGSAYTSKDMFAGCKSDVDFVQVLVAIDARPNIKIKAISHKQFVEYVGTHDVPGKPNIEQVNFAKEFEFRAEESTMEQAEREICRTLRLKDCQAWYVNDQNLCKKRELIATDATELAGYLRYDAINKMIGMLAEEITVNKGRAAYAGKGGDETDKFLSNLQSMQKKYRSPRFWIMLEKEFKDDPDKLVSSVCKFDSSTGNLSYCGTICLQMNEEATLKPTTEFFSMILYNSDPNSKVYLRRFLNPQLVTKVSPSDDIEGINNFDIFVIQEGPKPGAETEGVIMDYDRFIVKKVNEIPVTFRPKSGNDDRILQIALDGTQGIAHAKAKLCEAMEVPGNASGVYIFECIASEASTANPLKKRAFRRPMDQPVDEHDPRKIGDMFQYCEDGSKTLYYHL